MSPVLPPTKLDAAQVLQGSFDEVIGALRTTSTASIVPGSFDVSIDAATDSIALADATTGNKAGVTASNELKVVDASQALPGTPTIYNQTGVTAGVEFSYTYPTNTKKIYIKARNGVLKVAYTALGTYNNAYIFVPKGSSYCVDGVKTSAVVYVSSDLTNDVVEFQTWV